MTQLTMKSDYIFTEFFSRKGNERFLKDFLNAILKVEISKIEVIPQANLGKISKINKFGVIDLKVTLNDGIIIDVEMQVDDNHNWEKRVTFYAGKLIAADLSESEDYNLLKDIIVISILDYNLTDLPEYITESKIVAKGHSDYELVKGLKYYFIELPKFRKEKPDMSDKLNQWLAFIDGENGGLIDMAKRSNEELEKAVEEFERLRGDKEVVEIAEARSRSRHEEASIKAWAMKSGREAGLEEGRKEGRKEEKIKIAKEMLKNNVQMEIIAKCTGLTEIEIKKLNI